MISCVEIVQPTWMRVVQKWLETLGGLWHEKRAAALNETKRGRASPSVTAGAPLNGARALLPLEISFTAGLLHSQLQRHRESSPAVRHPSSPQYGTSPSQHHHCQNQTRDVQHLQTRHAAAIPPPSGPSNTHRTSASQQQPQLSTISETSYSGSKKLSH